MDEEERTAVNAGNCDGSILRRIISCQLIRAGCDIPSATITADAVDTVLLAICTFAVPSTLTEPPFAVNKFTGLLLFIFSLSRSAVSLDSIVCVPHKQLTSIPLHSRPARVSHSGACGVGRLCRWAV